MNMIGYTYITEDELDKIKNILEKCDVKLYTSPLDATLYEYEPNKNKMIVQMSIPIPDNLMSSNGDTNDIHNVTVKQLTLESIIPLTEREYDITHYDSRDEMFKDARIDMCNSDYCGNVFILKDENNTYIHEDLADYVVMIDSNDYVHSNDYVLRLPITKDKIDDLRERNGYISSFSISNTCINIENIYRNVKSFLLDYYNFSNYTNFGYDDEISNELEYTDTDTIPIVFIKNNLKRDKSMLDFEGRALFKYETHVLPNMNCIMIGDGSEYLINTIGTNVLISGNNNTLIILTDDVNVIITGKNNKVISIGDNNTIIIDSDDSNKFVSATDTNRVVKGI